jgi:hypothetical protein
MFKKIKYWLQHHDAIWSGPLAFASFFLIGYFLSEVLNLNVGTYDLGFIQPLFLAATVVIIATNIAMIGIRFTFYTLYKWAYGKRLEDGSIKNYSKIDWRILTSIQRFVCFGLVFVYFTSSIIFIYCHFIGAMPTFK